MAANESSCRRCGERVQDGGRQGPSYWALPEVHAAILHIAGGLVAIYFLLTDDPVLHLLGGTAFALVAISMAFRFRRRPDYEVIRRRRRARRLKRTRVSVLLVQKESAPVRKTLVDGMVVLVVEVHHDEIIMRLDSPVSIETTRSDLVSLLPAESGDSFSTLLDEGRMPVRARLVGRSYLSVARGNLLARRSMAENPPIDLGAGVAAIAPHRPE